MRRVISLCVFFLISYTVSAQVAETIVGWDSTFFSYQSTDNATYWRYPYANTGLPGNVNVCTMRTFGGVSPSTASDAYGNGNQVIFNENPGTGWNNGSGTKGWVFRLSTLGYESLLFSGKMAGTTSLSSFRGPRDFKLQYSLDSISWTDVSGGTLAAGSAGAASYTLNALNNVALPTVCNNQSSIYLRMIMTSNSSPDGATTTSAGQSIIDDFKVTGQSSPVAPSALVLSSQSTLVAIGAQTTIGASIGNLTSTDFNLGNTFTYSLVAGAGATHNTSFVISGSSLLTNANLPRGIYSIRVRTTDNTNLFLEKVFLIYVMETQPSIFSNPITGTSPTNSNPYTTGQTVAANLTVTGIKRGSGLTASTTNDRYVCTNWGTNLDATKYFEFGFTPSSGFAINFEYLECTIQRATAGAKNFTLRSSLDNYTADIFSLTNIPTTATLYRFPLIAPSYQSLNSTITFRLYGWNATTTTGSASINDFTFKGVVGNGCTPTSNTSSATACGSYTWTYNNQTYNSSGTYTVIGTNAGGCTHTETLNLTINPNTTTTTTANACYNYTWSANAQTYTTSGTYTSVVGCQTNTLNLQIKACADVKFLIEGYYVTGGSMLPVLSNQGVAGAGPTQADSVTIEFRNTSPPYTLAYSYRNVVNTSGLIHTEIPEAANNQSYYLAIRHRNALETWSKVPVLMGSNTQYDFTTAASKAYGDNQVQMELGKWALYSGDLFPDGAIDGQDYVVMDPDIISGATGYLVSDVNGDGVVDAFDFIVLSGNITTGVSYAIP